MSSNNSQTHYALFCIALVGALAYFIFIVLAVVAGIATFILTILAVIAWISDGLEIGEESITREDAVQFIVRGLIFAAGVPIFWALVCAVSDIPNSLPAKWLVTGGYIFGSTILDLLIDDPQNNSQESSVQRAIALPVEPASQGPHPSQTFEHPYYKFATWDEDRQP